MKIKVSTKNEHIFFFDIEDNLKKPETERFAAVMKKMHMSLHLDEWYDYDKDGNIEHYYVDKRLMDQTIKFVNAPELSNEETGEVIDKITPEVLLSDKYPELGFLVTQWIDFLNTLSEEKNEVRKK